MAQHDTILAGAFQRGQEATMTTLKTQSPNDVCPYGRGTRAWQLWWAGWHQELADADEVVGAILVGGRK